MTPKREPRPFSDRSIRRIADEFRATLKRPAPRERKPIRNGRVFYADLTLEPRLVQASVKDGTGKTWTATGASCRKAYSVLIDELEKEAGRGNEPVKILLGVIEAMPERPVKRRGPGQGSLL